LSVGLKTSLFERSGNYAASIISLGFWDRSLFENTDYLTLLPLQTYNFSFYIMSVTSWLDNGFYEVVSVSGGNETLLASGYNIDLKLNYKEVSGSFITTSDPTARIFVRTGIEGLGHVVLDDVFVSTAGDSPSVNFILDKEGVNTILYYSEDAAGNVEGTRQVEVKVDTLSPSFSGFEAFDAESLQKFASKIGVTDQTSGLVQDPALFNYAVDGFTAGFFENYNSCSGDFTQDEYIVLETNYLLGDTLGTVTTPQIDYCDTNWVNCKRLNFYVKDIAGNIGSHSICVNGPYITSNFGDTFAREGFYQMGLGDVDNLWGTAVSGGSITDVSSFLDVFVPLYKDPPYLNNTYSYYLKKLDNFSSFADTVNTSSGVFKIDGPVEIDNELNYTDSNQVVFVNGDLNINSNVTSADSKVFYIVNGNIYIDNLVTLVGSNLISTSQIFTASSPDLSERVTINGMLVAQELVFNRNTDRTLGASEIINYPINLFYKTVICLTTLFTGGRF
jgi:hypothetical protein